MDMNQVILHNLFARMKNVNEIEEDLVRHMILNSIRIYRNKFKKEYGEVVLTFDGGRYWRKDFFKR